MPPSVDVVIKGEGGKVVSRAARGRRPAARSTCRSPNATRWSPATPFLYDVEVTLARRRCEHFRSGEQLLRHAQDRAESRRARASADVPERQAAVPVRAARSGLVAGRPLHRADRRGAEYDIEVTKKLGFNMIRKHVKVEPARWYYWCDKLGSSSGRTCRARSRKRATTARTASPPESAKQFETELKAMIDALSNHPVDRDVGAVQRRLGPVRHARGSRSW